MASGTDPRYQQVADHLQQEILNGNYEEGDQLPSEARLCDYFDVSRVTVRHALQLLEQKNLIYRKQGLGAFVDTLTPETDLVRLTDFSEDMREAGFESSSELVSLNTVSPVPEVNEILNMKPDSKLIRIDRVRKANGKPVAFDITWLPPSYGQLLFDENLTTQTIYEVFEDKYEIPIIAGRYRLTACSADSYLAGQLNLPEGSALLEIDRCSRSTGNKKIYFQKRYYNPDKVSYEMELSRPEDSGHSSRSGLPLKEFVPRFAK